MPTLLQSLGIPSPRHAAEIERELGIRFSDFTPEHCDTWREQTLYLYQFAQTRTTTHAARTAGITLAAARQWQSDNTLGFNQRLDDAVLEYTDDMEVLFLERTRQPDSPTSFMTTLLRAQMPEKYGPARRSSPPRDNHGDNDDDPNPEISHNDDDSLEDIRRDLQDLKQFAGLTEPDPDPPSLEGEGWGEGEEHELSPIDQASVEAGLNPAPDLPPTGEDTSFSNLSPAGGETQRGGAPTPNDHACTEDTPQNAPTDQAPVEAGLNPAPDLPPTGEDTSFSNLSPDGGEIQRGGAPTPNDHACTEDTPQNAPTDQAPVEAGFKPALVLSPADEDTSFSNLSPADEETQREGTPHHPAPSTQNPSGLNRRQRRQLQRQSKRKHQISNRPRAPN